MGRPKIQDQCKPVKFKSGKIPIPRGKGHYAEAKKAEYIDKNLDKAKKHYLKEIAYGSRK